MDFASPFVNCAYDSEEDDLELSETEMDMGLTGGLEFDDAESFALPPVAPPPAAAPPQDDMPIFAAAAPPPAAAAAPKPGFFASLRDRMSARRDVDGEEDEDAFMAPPPRAPGGGLAPPPPPELLMEHRERRQKNQAKKKKKHKKRRRQRINTNIVSLKLGTLAAAADQIQTGDPSFCNKKGCRCVFNSHSEAIDLVKLREDAKDGEDVTHPDVEIEEDQRLWICEFCGEKNVIDFEEEEMPKGDSQDYILEPAPAKLEGDIGDESQIVIFCVDVSGSMCVTKEVKGKFKLKGDHSADVQGLNNDGSDQFLPGQSRHSTWVSRLQAVQAAVDNQIEKLAQTCPNYRVGLVTFSRDVTIYGDGTSDVEVVTGDKLKDQVQLQRVGELYRYNMPVKDSRDALCKTLFSLEEGGPTALGPALNVSIAMAAQQNGSKVIICTDGLANVGLGSMDIDMESDEEATEIENWYEGMGNYASMGGVTVSVISITDEQCRLENLGKVTDLTNGTVDQIDPLELMNNFAGILENPVVATNVNATMYVHRGLMLRREGDLDDEEAKQQENQNDFVTDRISRDIGNVTDDSQIFFEYSVKKEEIKKWKEVNALPFQVQIQYTRLDGSRCIRIITQVKPITLQQDVAEKDVNVRVMSARAAQHSARLAEKGDYEGSRAVNYGNALYLDRVCARPEQQMELQGHIREAASWDRVLHEEQQTEELENRSMAFSGKATKKKQRSRARKDHVSSAMYRMKKKAYK